MKLVIDTNILLSALIKDSTTRKLIMESEWQLFYPEISFHEVRKYKQLVLKKSGLSEEEYIKLLASLLAKISLVPLEQIQQKIREANNLIGKRDPKDVVFLATTLSIEDSKIWSNDKDYDEQAKVTRFDTEKVMKLFEKENEEE